MNIKIKLIFTMLFIIIFFTACGGGGGGGTSSSTSTKKENIQVGYFIDSAVEGIEYKTDSKNGVTDKNGKFEYLLTDKNITFSLGKVVLGDVEVKKINKDKKVFPSDLAKTKRGDFENKKVVKLLQLLQSLDDDNNPDNGITIKSKSKSMLTKSLNIMGDKTTTKKIDDLIKKAGKNIVSVENAKKHYIKTLKKEPFLNIDKTPPVILNKMLIYVKENQRIVTLIKSKDDSKITYSLSGTNKDKFSINKDGFIMFKEKPDYEKRRSYVLSVIAKDSFYNETKFTFVIRIEDVEEKETSLKPIIEKPKRKEIITFTSPSVVNVNENQFFAYKAKVQNDLNVRYSLYSSSFFSDESYFSIDSYTGEVRYKDFRKPDYESEKKSYTIKIIASGESSNKAEKSVEINILDVDENEPTITSPSIVNVNENQVNAYTVVAKDENKIEYKLSTNSLKLFNINSNTGKVTFKKAPNFEEKSSYTLNVKAIDSLGNKSTQTVIVNIIDLKDKDDVKPIITSPSIVSIIEGNIFAYKIIAKDSVDKQLLYEIEGIDANYFNINSKTGKVTFKLAPQYKDKTSYSLVLKVSDSAKNIASKNLLINIIDSNSCFSKEVGTQCKGKLIVDRSLLLKMIKNKENVSNVYTGKITDMSKLFDTEIEFNDDISSWDVSNVRNMESMFFNAVKFNSDISNWNVSKVTNMSSMFENAKVFNSDISNWDVGNVTNMYAMFKEAKMFNSDISNWNVSNVENMSSMFEDAILFNSELNNWDVGNVISMDSMFAGAKKFNQDLSLWDVSNVTNMEYMFYGTTFNQSLNPWNVSNVKKKEKFNSNSSLEEKNMPYFKRGE